MLTYEQLVPTLKGLFPDVVNAKDYIAANENVPYAFVADLLDHLRDEFVAGNINIDDPRVARMFAIITELERLPKEENKEIVPAGFFETMLLGHDSDRYFIEAAKKYLDQNMWRLFRIVQTQYIGDPKDFIDSQS